LFWPRIVQSDKIEEQEELLLLTESEKSKANWLKLAIILGIDCGLRRGGIIKLRRENINFLTSTALLIGTKKV
jgi:integrase